MICFLGSILSITMLEFSIKVSSNSLIEVCTRFTKLLSKVCAEQRLEALVYVCDQVLNLLMLFLCIAVSFWSCVKWHTSYSRVTHKNQWTCEYQVKIELYHITNLSGYIAAMHIIIIVNSKLQYIKMTNLRIQ